MTVAEYEIVDISAYEEDDFEPMGTKSKFWFKDKEGIKKLFKATLSLDKTGCEVERKGEDWAEKIAYEIASLIGLPCARYELGIYKGQNGVVTESFVDEKDQMVLGNQLLSYISEKIGDIEVDSRGRMNRLGRIYVVMERVIVRKPLGWDSLPNINIAHHVFVGYLMLDALISNQDRHEENWGLILTKDKTFHLAPTFDHAASLGRNESDETRLERLNSNDAGRSVSSYVKRAKSQVYAPNGTRIKTLDAFEAYGVMHPRAALSWLERLNGISDADIRVVVDRVPTTRMSNIAKDFAFSIMAENKRRIIGLTETLHQAEIVVGDKLS